VYLSSLHHLLGGPSTSKVELLPGQYKFDFTCQLPPAIPTSFVSKLGSIQYKMEVTVERSWKSEQNFEFPFTVIHPLDLNSDKTLKIPMKSETSKVFTFGSGTLHLSASIPFSGFVAGQLISVSVDVNNQSETPVKEIKISLKKLIKYNR